MTTPDGFEEVFDRKSKVFQVYSVLKDQQWHCRECQYTHVGITQIAGGSGIQGLQRGNRSRAGMRIQSSNQFCYQCERTTRQDRWDGTFEPAVPTPSMASAFARRVYDVLGKRDIVEGTERPLGQLTIDHKLPMMRWNDHTKVTQTDYTAMSDEDIQATFQLLKKSNESASHNQLKSRACERCFRYGTRGEPFGITFFYEGGPTWKPDDKRDPKGCAGCGWYDFDEWRKHLNVWLAQTKHEG